MFLAQSEGHAEVVREDVVTEPGDALAAGIWKYKSVFCVANSRADVLHAFFVSG